jgi:ribosomal protein L11 methyltransferase
MESYIQFTFQLAAGPMQELLIAELTDWPFEGFEEQSEHLIAFIPESDCDSDLRNMVTELVGRYGVLSVEEQIILPTNWNADWERNYEPVLVDSFCVVRADFHPNYENIAHEILITPKMSFGTGHHATTFMMIQAMQPIDFKEMKVLDYGCGTAVLAILAAKLGALHIDAIDNDTWAYQNSLENIALNNCQQIISVQEGDWSVVAPNVIYNIILANINRNIILQSMPAMAAQLADDGVLLCSGFLQNDVELIVESAGGAGLQCISSNKKEQWHCLGFKKV